MGKSPGRMLDRYSLYSLLRRVFSKGREARE
jgi:hypothetical protein